MFTMYYTMYSSASLETGKSSETRLVAVGLIKELYVLPPTSELCLAAILPSVGG